LLGEAQAFLRSVEGAPPERREVEKLLERAPRCP